MKTHNTHAMLMPKVRKMPAAMLECMYRWVTKHV